MLVSTLLGLTLVTSGRLAPVGWAIIAYTALLALTLSRGRVIRRLLPLNVIEQDTTANALRRARRACRAARRILREAETA